MSQLNIKKESVPDDKTALNTEDPGVDFDKTPMLLGDGNIMKSEVDLGVFEWEDENSDANPQAVPDKAANNSGGSEGMYQPGSMLEALDINTNKWYSVKVLEVDWDDREVLIHFDKWSQRYDEWIPMNSSRLRTAKRADDIPQNGIMSAFQVGEMVMATWSDSRKYPATVKAVLSGDNFEVLFFDGFTRTMKIHKLAKCSGVQGVDTDSPLMMPATMTKAERRERKRKIQSVAELFHTKRAPKRVKEETSLPKVPVIEPGRMAKIVRETSLKSKKRSTYTDLSASDNEGEKTYINLNASLTQDDAASPTKQRAAAEDNLPTKRKRSYNKVFLDSSPGPSTSLRGKRYGEGVTPGEYDNWEPEGEEAYLVETSDGLRRSIIVEDDRLPEGWAKHTIQRRAGNSAGKWDVFLVSPSGRRFRSRKEMVAYFVEKGEVYQPDLFDFTLRGLSKRPLCDMRLKNSDTLNFKPKPASEKKQKTRAAKPAAVGSAAAAADEDVEAAQRRVKTLLPRAPALQKGEGQSSPPPPHNPCTVQVSPPAIGPVTPLAVPLDNSLTPRPLAAMTAASQSDSNGFICPGADCKKLFRKENLLHMHIKHYHPEYSQFVGAAPNVADLAYARTVRAPLEELSPAGSFLDKINLFEATKKANLEAAMSPPPPVPEVVGEKKKAVAKEPSKMVPAEPPTPPAAAPASTPLRDLLSKDPVAAPREQPKVGVTAGIKTLLPIVRTVVKIPLRDMPLAEQRPMSESFGSLQEGGKTGGEPKSKRKRRLSDSYHKRRKSVKPVILDDIVDQITLSGEEGGTNGTFLTPSARHQTFKRKKTPLLAASLQAKPLFEALDTSDSRDASPLPATPLTEEQLNKRDIINCTCGVMEEDGLMIQCDLCLCWQHGYCNSIEKESEVPEKYVCYICQHPMRERKSMRHLHNQDWLKEGCLPGMSGRTKDSAAIAKRTDLLHRSHDLTATLLEMRGVVRGLRVKVNIANTPDHPKLYLWSKPWEKHTFDNSPTPDPVVKTEVAAAPSAADNLVVKTETGDASLAGVKKEAAPEKEENVAKAAEAVAPQASAGGEGGGEVPTEGAVPGGAAKDGAATTGGSAGARVAADVAAAAAEGEQASDATGKPLDAQVGGAPDSQILLHALTQGQPIQLDDDAQNQLLEFPISQKELMHFAHSMASNLKVADVNLAPEAPEEAGPAEVAAPEPEKPIEPVECRLLLLDHIQHHQLQIRDQLQLLEDQISALEAEDPDPLTEETLDFYPHTKQTVKMLLRDLTTVRNISTLN